MQLDCQECPRSIQIHSRWDSIRAWDEGWFQSKDGKMVFCPEHLPDWVIKWRAEQKAKKAGIPTGNR